MEKMQLETEKGCVEVEVLGLEEYEEICVNEGTYAYVELTRYGVMLRDEEGEVEDYMKKQVNAGKAEFTCSIPLYYELGDGGRLHLWDLTAALGIDEDKYLVNEEAGMVLLKRGLYKGILAEAGAGLEEIKA